ncbi:MAG: RidA family protein [Phycisphaerales bacterium]|nr:RidA family protein [Phycisphaerales bacterium]
MTINHPQNTLEQLGITLPEAPKPVASYVPANQSGNHIYISGQIPFQNGQLFSKGIVPSQVDVDTAIECSRLCTINALACLKAEIGDLGRVTKVVKVGVFVACESDFGDQPTIANGCSNLLVDIFGAKGQHARAAVGVASLPLNVPVEIEFIFEID